LAYDEWMNRRAALHDRFMSAARAGDASRLAYLHGPETEWTQEEVAGLWERAVRNPIGKMPALNCVYIHVPFCKSICNFCNYDRLQPSSPELLKTWLARVLQSIELIAPKLRPWTFHALYMGGGTPSVLPARLLHQLLETVDSALSWHPQASRKMEFDPAVMNRERLEVLAAHRFQQLSFGIETLDPEINARHNRGRQGIEIVERSFGDLKAVGFDDVACDFLLGLQGTTPEGMLAEMETVLRRFQPNWVDIFMLTPTQAYLKSHFGGSWDAFWAHIKPFEAIIPPALPALAERTGYSVRMGQGHHMMLMRQTRSPSELDAESKANTETGGLARYGYTALTSESRRPLNVLGLGRSARSTIFGVAAFAAHDPEDSPWAEGPASYVGNEVDLADEARTFLVHVLRDNDAIDREEFRQIFGGDMTEIIPTALTAWEKEGTAKLDQDALRFARQDRLDRLRSLLWLVPQEAVEFDLAQVDDLQLSPSGVARLLEPIEPGTTLAGGHTFAGADGARLLVRTPEGETIRLRVAPALSEGGPLRLVLEAAPKTGDIDALRHAVGQLRAAITRRHRKFSAGARSHRPAGEAAPK
jgi:coproporphyrinogen III oxidase-like Fe-S oxidoreductase